jgi:hypothetical protein
MGEVVCAIPDLRAVGSALLRPRPRAVGSCGGAGQRAHSTVVHGSATAHAEALPPRLPGHPRLARSIVAVPQAAQPPADHSVRRLRSRRHWTAPADDGAARRFPVPHRLGNALEPLLRLASPLCPPGGPHMLVPAACSRLCLALPWHHSAVCGAGALATSVLASSPGAGRAHSGACQHPGGPLRGHGASVGGAVLPVCGHLQQARRVQAGHARAW